MGCVLACLAPIVARHSVAALIVPITTETMRRLYLSKLESATAGQNRRFSHIGYSRP